MTTQQQQEEVASEKRCFYPSGINEPEVETWDRVGRSFPEVRRNIFPPCVLSLYMCVFVRRMKGK